MRHIHALAAIAASLLVLPATAQAKPEKFLEPVAVEPDLQSNLSDLAFDVEPDVMAQASCTFIFATWLDGTYTLTVGTRQLTGVVPGPNNAETRRNNCNNALSAANAALLKPAQSAQVQTLLQTGGYSTPARFWPAGAPYILNF